MVATHNTAFCNDCRNPSIVFFDRELLFDLPVIPCKYCFSKIKITQDTVVKPNTSAQAKPIFLYQESRRNQKV